MMSAALFQRAVRTATARQRFVTGSPLSVLRNFVYLLSGETTAKVIGFFSTVVVIRTIDRTQFGIVAIALAAVGFADAAVLRGLEMHGMRVLSPWRAHAVPRIPSILAARVAAALF